MDRRRLLFFSCLAVTTPAFGQVDPWAAPSDYYQSVSGEGAALRQSLALAMSAGHMQQRYGDFRYSALLHDADPDRPGNILLAYNRQSVSGTWDSGSTWNREHVWPQSRQPGSASNSTRGNLGDPHALRPCNPTVNSQRSNKPFGLPTTAGVFRSLGSYWFPGDQDKGDIARSLFYSSVRYDLPLSDDFPSSNQMGDLGSMVAHHYADVPDEFERRRNHVIYSQSENPDYYTNNRSAFVDLPWAVWSVFMDDQNDSQLYVGSGPAADGSSGVVIQRRAIEGAVIGSDVVSLQRGGTDGVYYAVRSSGDVTTDQSLEGGFTGAFAIGDASPRSISVGLDAGVVSGPGRYSGRVVIDNLDVTTGLGAGFGGLDGDDVIDYSIDVLSPSAASFDAGTVVSTVDLDAGLLTPGETVQIGVPVHALDLGGGFSAGAVLSAGSSSGDVADISLALPSGVITPGSSLGAVVEIRSPASGDLEATFEILSGDDPSVLGAGPRGALTLRVTASVGGCNGADMAAPFGVISQTDVVAFVDLFFAGDARAAALASPFDVVSQSDVTAFVDLFFAGCAAD